MGGNPAPRARSSRIIGKLRRNLRDYGLARTLIKTAGSLFSPVFYRRTYFLYGADLSRIEAAPAGTRFTFRRLSAADAVITHQLPDMEEWLGEKLAAHLRVGALCVAAMDGEKVAGFNLISFRALHLPVVHYARPLRPREAFSIQISVAKEYRGQGLGTALRMEVFRELKKAGAEILYGGVDVHNRASLALNRKAGFTRIATVRYTKVFNIQKTTLQRIQE